MLKPISLFLFAALVLINPASSNSGNHGLAYINATGLSYAELQLGAVQFGDRGWGPRESVALGLAASQLMLGLQTAYMGPLINLGGDILVGKNYAYKNVLARNEMYFGAQLQADLVLVLSLRVGVVQSFSGSQTIFFGLGLGLNSSIFGPWRFAQVTNARPNLC